MEKEYNYKRGLLIYILSSIFFIIIGILIASGLSLPSSTTAEQPKAIMANVPVGNMVLPVSPSGHSPFVAVASNVKDAVVNISAESITETPGYHNFLPNDDFFRRFFGIPNNNGIVPQKRRIESLGSGFIIDKDGYIVTNNHVVKGADKIFVRLSNASEYPAKLVGTDPETDIAVLKIDPDTDLTVARLGDSDSILVGDWAIAIGNPFPQLGLDRTVTVGVISATGRQGLNFSDATVSYQDYIQTDASINKGNSGGPLVNIEGEVIGINSAIASNTGGSVGIGFAIPINLAKPVIEQLKTNGSVSRGWLGVSPQKVDKDLAEALGLSSTEGVLIGEVIPNTPADNAGLKAGDVIVKFGDKKIKNVKQFRFLIAENSPNTPVNMEIIRDGKKKKIKVILGDRSEFLTSGNKVKQNQEAKFWLGLKVETFTKAKAEELGIDFQPCVMVNDVEIGSPADRDGIRKYDLILEIDGLTIKSVDDFNKVAEKLSNRKKAILFYIKQGKTSRYVAIKPVNS